MIRGLTEACAERGTETWERTKLVTAWERLEVLPVHCSCGKNESRMVGETALLGPSRFSQTTLSPGNAHRLGWMNPGGQDANIDVL